MDPVLKTGGRRRPVGSNPTPSAPRTSHVVVRHLGSARAYAEPRPGREPARVPGFAPEEHGDQSNAFLPMKSLVPGTVKATEPRSGEQMCPFLMSSLQDTEIARSGLPCPSDEVLDRGRTDGRTDGQTGGRTGGRTGGVLRHGRRRARRPASAAWGHRVRPEPGPRPRPEAEVEQRRERPMGRRARKRLRGRTPGRNGSTGCGGEHSSERRPLRPHVLRFDPRPRPHRSSGIPSRTIAAP